MKGKNNSSGVKDLELAFDVGHSSIGWAVLRNGQLGEKIELLGCGTVIFRADDCLASSRRAYRRQRRHIRSTRQRIDRMKRLLESMGVMSRKELDRPGCAWPWKLAAQVLQSKTKTNRDVLLSWPELWDVLRWYAHNRGYDGNRRWSGNVPEEAGEDTEKVENANALMKDFHTTSMAATVCAVSGIDPLGKIRSSNVEPSKRFKARNAAFPRDVVEREVREILRAHVGVLKGVDGKLEEALFTQWRAIPCAEIRLPKRYQGGLLFGQLVPRFDNRIISICPITGDKVPVKHSREFMDYRWGMQLANVRVGDLSGNLRPLAPEERKALDVKMRAAGSMTEREFKDAVRGVTGCKRDNLETMLMHPDAKEALVLDPVQKEVTKGHWGELFPVLSERVQKRARGRLWQGKEQRLEDLLVEEIATGGNSEAFEAALSALLDRANTKKRKKEGQVTREEVLGKPARIRKQEGRAAYSRKLLRQAFEESLAGKHPKEPNGCLFVTDEMRSRQLNRSLAEQTNNHLIRHRLLILERLLTDITKEYAEGDKERVRQVTIEVNRDLRAMSGKTAKEIQQDLGRRLANHSGVVKKLEKALEGTGHRITAGLIRKARIAEDLGWVCPYTGKQFEPIDLITRRVDKDHIIPRSLRPADSLESLVMTFNEVNLLKKNRTAVKFLEEEAGRAVPGMPNLSLMPLNRFKEWVEKLEAYKGHEDDKRRKKKRKELLLLEEYEEKEFTPKDLTATSQLVRLGAQAITKVFSECAEKPRVISLPGSVTGTIRKAWDVTGCLAQANPLVLDEHGKVRTKTEIRDITHLHHALDACVLGFAAHFIPNNGRVWELLVKRTLNSTEERELSALGIVSIGEGGKFQVRDLGENYKAQIRDRVSEKRVVQHVPARMDGLRAEQNTWRVLEEADGEATICQYRRSVDGKRQEVITTEKAGKLLGLAPKDGNGKLKRLKGVLVIPENFGIALEPTPSIIPFHKVAVRLAMLKKENGGRKVGLLRNGEVITVPSGKYKGIWKVFSVKNSKEKGLIVDLGSPDLTRMKSKGEGIRREIKIVQLIKDGMKKAARSYTGITSCPTTSSA